MNAFLSWCKYALHAPHGGSASYSRLLQAVLAPDLDCKIVVNNYVIYIYMYLAARVAWCEGCYNRHFC